MRALQRLALVIVAAICMAMGTASAQVMQHVPSDALVIVKVNNLKGFSDKIAGLAQRFGVTQFLPSLMDPLSSLEQNLKLTQGINSSGDAALALLDPAKFGGMGKRPGLLLLPVSDYSAFLSNFSRPTEASDQPTPDNAAPATSQAAAPKPDAQGIATIAFPNAFDTAYVAHWGNYAAISHIREAVLTPGTGMTVSGLAAKEMNEKDLIIYANMQAVKAKALPALQANRERIQNEIKRGLTMGRNPANAAMLPMAQSMVNLALDDAQRLLEDSQAATYGISIENTGIRTTILAEFIPSTPIGQTVSQLENSDASMLAGLPQDKYLFYGGAQWNPQRAAQLFDQLVGPVRTQLSQATTQSAEPVVKMIDLYRKIFTSSEAQSMGWIAPTGPLGLTGLFNVISVQTGDAATLLTTQKAMMDLQPEFYKNTNGNPMKISTSYTENAKQIDGISFNQINVKFDMTNLQTPQDRQAAQMMAMMYGPNGMTGLVG
ncbi:MAG TPA: hypothetical protein VG722_08360, partial [Tepidisphaeraceae bacterium]|nr:hypothetical protein [Tepidisphaeraceae bacterium]